MTTEQDITSAKRTIDKEIEALRMMEDELNDSLSRALDLKTLPAASSSPAWENPATSAAKLPPPWRQPEPRRFLFTLARQATATSAWSLKTM